MNKRRIWILGLCGILAMASLNGCSQSSNPKQQAGSEMMGGETPPEKPDGENPPAMPGGGQPGGMTSKVDHYDAVTEITEDATIEEGEYTSTGKDENAIHVLNGANATLKNLNILRNSTDSTGGDQASFYGVGAAVLVSEGTADITGGLISTDAPGGAGIFAYDQGIVHASDVTITTKQNTSGGIHVAGGGTLYATNLNVTTEGESAAAIRSDRGGGTMVIDGGQYTSQGVGSPAVYCTADITVSNASLSATGSEAVCIEGLNTLRLVDTELVGNMSDDPQNDCTWNVIVYQSMSGDSQIGNGTFEMTGGKIHAENGGMFYTTNTECTIVLSGVEIESAEENDFFLRCTGNQNRRGWGQSGNNGSQCTFRADNQTMVGDVIYDSISTLDFQMTNHSTLRGAFLDDESCAGAGGDGSCKLYISEDSRWIVTGDSVLTSLSCDGEIVDSDGNTVTIQKEDGTVVVRGESEYTVTIKE